MTVAHELIQWTAGHSFRLLRWHNDLREMDLIIEPGRTRRIHGSGEQWHYHRAFELTWFRSGAGTRCIGDRMRSIRAGDLVLLGSNLPHYWHTHGKSAGWSVQWDWEPTHHVWAVPETQELTSLFREAACGVEFSGRAADAMAARLPELAETSGLDRLALLLRILAVAAAAPKQERAVISRNPKLMGIESRHQVAMQAAIRFLLEHFRRPIRLAELLTLTRMSRPTFSRQFKAHAGKSVGTFLHQIRIEASSHELAETDRAVTDIAMENGLSVSFFNRLFRRVHGCSPLEYRRHQRRTLRSLRPR